MAHISVKVYVHIVFSTKKREPYIQPEIESDLFTYMQKICKSLECLPLSIGGHKDHVHILCELNKNLSLVELIDEVKIATSRWFRSKCDSFRSFSWQQGYAGFSVGEEDLRRLTHYIENQKQHHSVMRFEEEYRRLLSKNEIQFDEHLVWK